VFAQSNLVETTPTETPLSPLLHLTPLLSIPYALFSLTALKQPFSFQSLPHSFYRHGGVPPSCSVFILSSALVPCLPRVSRGEPGDLRGNQSETLLCRAKHEFANPLFSAHYTLFQVPYLVTPLFATLMKTTGVCTNSSHSGSPRARRGGRRELSQSPLTSPASPLPLTPAALQHTIPPARRFLRNRTSRGGAIL
jgi:hypothetical protein